MPPAANFGTLFQSTLLMRGATSKDKDGYYFMVISIHAPHARSDLKKCNNSRRFIVFQSTLLMRGATSF